MKEQRRKGRNERERAAAKAKRRKVLVFALRLLSAFFFARAAYYAIKIAVRLCERCGEE